MLVPARLFKRLWPVFRTRCTGIREFCLTQLLLLFLPSPPAQQWNLAGEFKGQLGIRVTSRLFEDPLYPRGGTLVRC